MITDSRTVADFQHFTFSGHSRKLANKSLLESIQLGHADYACYWSLELLCSGLVHSLWDTLFESGSLYIHRSCPNIFTYLTSQYERFGAIEASYSVNNMTSIRNRDDARILVCETATALAIAKKQKSVTLPTIKPEHDFQAQTVRENLRATTQNAGSPFLKPDDPFELTIPFNEFCFSIQTRDTLRALYWMSWILRFTAEKKKQTKQSVDCAERRNPYVDSKYAKHVHWMFWEAIRAQSNIYIESLFKLYCMRWSKNKTYLITAVVFVTEVLNTTEPARRNESEISVNMQKIPQWIETIEATKNSFSSRQ